MAIGHDTRWLQRRFFVRLSFCFIAVFQTKDFLLVYSTHIFIQISSLYISTAQINSFEKMKITVRLLSIIFDRII